MGIPMKANIGSHEEVQAMFAKVAETVGPVNILVNNAGITRDMLTMMMKPSDFTDVINLNLNGVFFCSQAAFVGSMMGNKVVNIIVMLSNLFNSYRKHYRLVELSMLHQLSAKLVIQARLTMPPLKGVLSA